MGSASRREQLEELLKIDPDDNFIRYALAMEYAGEGKSEHAIEQFRAVIQADPDYVAAYQQLAQLLIDTGDRDAAKQILADGVEAARRQNDPHAADKMQGVLDVM